MSIGADPAIRPSVLARILGAGRTLIFGALLSLTAPTSLIVLGWLMRRMRGAAYRAVGLGSVPPGWISGSGKGIARVLGGLGANIREGVMAAASMALATAPFTVIWLLSWWAGWENSFSKGYEQAFVGPLLGMAGVVVFCAVMIWLPMALAHQAVENRALALFEWRMVRSAVRHSGWGYVFLSTATVIAALPFFASRGLVTFASQISPSFDMMTVQEASDLAGAIDLGVATYVFVALIVLRTWCGRLYGRAVARATDGPDATLWASSPLVAGHVGGRRSWQLTHWARLVLLSVIWFGLAAQIFVAQFLNHDWHLWVTHPLIFLPWPG